jgi:hypothetical protein
MSTGEEFVEDLDQARAEIRRLQQGNIDKVNALGKFGKVVDPASLANLKIDVFIESFLDDKAQLVYVRNLEVRFRAMLDEALASVRQEQLTQGAVAPKGLIVPR